MEYQKILNLLNEAGDSKFVTGKWNIVNDQSNYSANYSAANKITYNIKVFKSNVRDYNDAYILLRGDITITRCNLLIRTAFNTVKHSLSVSRKFIEQ